jgi:hypothetical protein
MAAQRKPVQSADTDFSQLFKDFHSRHRDADGNKLKFTTFFNGLLEAFIENPELQLWMRAIIWVVRYSWGNDADFAVSQIKGPPVHQQDFAQRIGIDKRRASEAFAEAEAMGYLTTEGYLLYPVDQPARNAKSNQNGKRSDEGALFPDSLSPFLRWCEEEWKVLSSSDFRALQDAEATVRRIRLVRLGLWRQVKKARTSGGPIIIDQTSITIKSASSSVSAGLSTEEEPTPTTTSSPLKGAPEPPIAPESAVPPVDTAPIVAALERYGTPEPAVVERLVENCRKEEPTCTGPEIAEAIRTKAKQAAGRMLNPIGFMLVAIPKCFADGAFRQAKMAALERQRKKRWVDPLESFKPQEAT